MTVPTAPYVPCRPVTIDNVPDDGDASDGPPGARDNVRMDVENIVAGDGDDHLTGGPVWGRLVGNGGDDTLEGGDGGDALEGGPGDDLLVSSKKYVGLQGGPRSR